MTRLSSPTLPLTFSPETFAVVFPYYCAFDRQLKLLYAGERLLDLLPKATGTPSVDTVLQIKQPAVPFAFSAIYKCIDELFVLGLTSSDVRLEGRMIHIAEHDIMLFLGASVGSPLERSTAHNENGHADAQTWLESPGQFRELFDGASEAIVISDRFGRIVHSNKRSVALFGYTKEELIGESIELLVPDQLRSNHTSLRRSFEAHPQQRPMGRGMEVNARRRDGTVFPVEISLSPITLSTGAFVASFITDISERRISAEAVAAQRDFARQITATMGQGLAVTDVDGITTFVNPALTTLIGHPVERLVGAPLLDFVHRDDYSSLRRLFLAQIDGQSAELELRLVAADGALRHVQVNCVALRQEELTTGIILVFSDMAKHKQIEQELKRARDRAQEASRLKSDFLATISHEMRTPLNSIIGVSELLADSEMDRAQRDLVQMIGSASERLLAQVNDILDFSKMEAGQLSLDFMPFDLRECLEAALDTVLPMAAQKELAIGYLLELPAPQRIFGDDQRLRQILVNLLENAVKYTEQGEINLTVTPYRVDADEAAYELSFAIQDTGIGIPPERQAQLFEGFNQLDSSTTRKYEGAGLGLAISQRLCHAMGGQMWIESSGVPGRGSTVCFTLPTVDVAETEHEVKRPTSELLRGPSLVFVLGNAHNAPLWRNLVLLVQTWAMDARLCTTLEEASAMVHSGGHLDGIVVDQTFFEEEMVATPVLNEPHWADAAVIVVTRGDRAYRRPSFPASTT